MTDPVTSVPAVWTCTTTQVQLVFDCPDWEGEARIAFPNGLPSGLTLPSGIIFQVNNGVGLLNVSISAGIPNSFQMSVQTLSETADPNNCIDHITFNYVMTIQTDCPSCNVVASIVSSTNETCENACDGTATASGSGGSGNYTYLWDDPSGQTTPTAVGLCDGSYNVTVTDQADPTCSDVVSVTIGAGAAYPNASISGDNDICEGDTTLLTADGGASNATYLWSTGATTKTIQEHTSVDTTYSVVISNNGCIDSADINVTVTPSIFPIFFIDRSYCKGDIPDDLLPVSFNGISGTWNPDEINTQLVGTTDYVFTPTSGVCVRNLTVSVTVTEVAVNVWVGGATGNWTDFVTNWSLGSIPQPCDKVIIPAGVHVTVKPNKSVNCATIEVDSNAILTVHPTAKMTVDRYQ